MTAKKDPSKTKSEALSEAWKKRPDHLGEWKQTRIYSTWRSIRHNKKGKDIGSPDHWKFFWNFKDDVLDENYSEDKVLLRIDKNLPFSKENCYWGDVWETAIHKNSVFIEYDGESKTLRQWSESTGMPLNGIKKRYYTGKNYTNEEIIFGKKKTYKKQIRGAWETTDHQLRRNKASKMLSQYRLADRKRGFVNTPIDLDWFVENILLQRCTYCGTFEQVGADRMDNTQGHTYENMIPCCYTCNCVKNDGFSYDEMKKIGQFLRDVIYKEREDGN